MESEDQQQCPARLIIIIIINSITLAYCDPASVRSSSRALSHFILTPQSCDGSVIFTCILQARKNEAQRTEVTSRGLPSHPGGAPPSR